MASDVRFSDCLSDDIDLNKEVFIKGGVMDPKDIFLTDLACTKDTASSSDSGISTVDEFQDIADVSDLNGFLETDFQELDFAFDLNLQKEDTFLDSDTLIKTEPLSPSPPLSSDGLINSDGCCTQPISPTYYSCTGEVCVKEELGSHGMSTYHQHQAMPAIQPGLVPQTFSQQQQQAYSPQHIYHQESSHEPTGYFVPSPPSSSPSSSSSSSSPTSFPSPRNQNVYLSPPGSFSPQQVSAVTSPTSHANYVILPSIKTEHENPSATYSPQQSLQALHSSSSSSCPPSSQLPPLSLLRSGNSLAPNQVIVSKPAAAANLNAILSSKIKIQPKPGADGLPSSTPGNGQWTNPCTSQAAFPTQTVSVATVLTSAPLLAANGTASLTDSKSFKKQQRIIKNRESASASRKRKKEYMTSLEEKLQAFSNENNRLLKENEVLRRQVDYLQTENSQLKSQGSGLSPAKRACLMCVAVLLTLNLSPLGSYLSGPVSEGQSLGDIKPHIGRQLLSVPSDGVPSTRFQNGAWYKSAEQEGYDRWEEEMSSLMQRLNRTGHMCPVYFNSTESLRLAEQLTGWMIRQEEEKKKKEEKKRQKKKKDYLPLRRFGSAVTGWSQSPMVSRGEIQAGQSISGRNYPLQVFRDQDTKQQLLNAIPRRNDTFYILSFSTDYYLVPASAHNKTMRPRMSLLMPVVSPPRNESLGGAEDTLGMMQIDCEILNTKLVQVQRSAFPPGTPLNSTSFSHGQGGEEARRGSRGDKSASGNSTAQQKEKYWENLGRTRQ